MWSLAKFNLCGIGLSCPKEPVVKVAVASLQLRCQFTRRVLDRGCCSVLLQLQIWNSHYRNEKNGRREAYAQKVTVIDFAGIAP
jgi:hypothetical protein